LSVLETPTIIDDSEKLKKMYKVFKEQFGRMLGETRANCFQEWMPPEAQKDITKAQWLAVLKESNSLWHAVVLAFREAYEALQSLDGKFRDIEVSEQSHGNATPSPTHHISDLVILCKWGRKAVDVARGRWSAYIRKMFAENTVHFVREYQRLLMARFETSQQKLYGFWFYPSDLCAWVRDIQDAARLKNAPAEASAQSGAATRVVDRNASKRFRWPACCKKGNNLQDPNSITTPAYKAFCRQNGLWSDSRNSRLQFCQRMRAAWLRLVDAYEWHDGQAPSEAAVVEYLKKQKIFEVRLEKNAEGRMSAVEEDSDILKDPASHTTEELRKGMPTRRVLVYGAPLVNPYLCG